MARLARLSILFFAALLWTATHVAAKDFGGALIPKPAVVATPGATVRSGPGDSYYLTDTLPQDSAVEVYQQRPDGWCAIRPPEDSFSWVYAANVRLIDEQTAEVAKSDVASRVGSRLSAQRDAVQVRLDKGEVVAIVGSDDRDGKTWYKIAPPAGEFRWMHAKDLSIEGARPMVVTEDPEVTPAAHEAPAGSTNSGQWTAITAPPLASEAPMPPPPAVAEPIRSTYSAAAPATAPPSMKPTNDITPVGPGSASSGNLAAQLNDLEMRLSRMVAEPMNTWSIAPLEQAAEQLLARADTVEDREAVKSTLAKIDRFAAIQRRSAGLNATVATSAPTGGVMGAPAGMVPVVTGQSVDPNAAEGASGSPHDAVGMLRPVVSRRPGAPQFALVDDQGQVVTFVTPMPDVNLQPFVGRKIAISGTRGYIPEFRRPHVTAGRVTPLNERMLR